MTRTGPRCAAFCRSASGTATREAASGGEALRDRDLAGAAGGGAAAPKYSVVGPMRISGAATTPWTGAEKAAAVTSRESQETHLGRNPDAISRPFIGAPSRFEVGRRFLPFYGLMRNERNPFHRHLGIGEWLVPGRPG